MGRRERYPGEVVVEGEREGVDSGGHTDGTSPVVLSMMPAHITL